MPWEGWITWSRCLAAWGSTVSPVSICCFLRLLIPIGKLITPIPRRTVFGEPQLTSIGGTLFVSSLAKCGVSWNVASVYICVQTVVTRICCGHFCNDVRLQFRSFHIAAFVPFFSWEGFQFFQLEVKSLHMYCAYIFVTLWYVLESSWSVMAHDDAREGKWRGNWRMEWVASTLHTTSDLGVSNITTADAHTSAASSRLNWRPCRFKWTRPFRRKTKSGFCACTIIFQTQSTSGRGAPKSEFCAGPWPRKPPITGCALWKCKHREWWGTVAC